MENSRCYRLKMPEYKKRKENKTVSTKNTTRRIVMAAMLAALACVATMIVKIPSPLKGYINLGDCIVLLAGWSLSPLYGFLAAGIGSALADLFSGYGTYVPATFLIKGLMAFIAYLLHKAMRSKMKPLASWLISGAAAEVWMVAGYLLFEGILYGFVPSLVNVPANAVQGVAGLVLGCVLIKVFEKSKIDLK